MDDAVKNLTAEQALEVLTRLSESGGEIRNAVLAEDRKVLSAIDLQQTADEVFFVLDAIDVQDCWDRAGSHRDGYTSPDEAALQLIEEQLQPFFDQARRYHEAGMTEEESTYCMGVILGIYCYQHESKSEFREWSVDIPIDCAGALLGEWRERGQDSTSAAAIEDFIRQRCSNWARFLL